MGEFILLWLTVEGWFRGVNYPVFSACFTLVPKTVVRQGMQVLAAGISSHVKDQKVLHTNVQIWVSDFSGSRGLSCIRIHRTAGPAPHLAPETWELRAPTPPLHGRKPADFTDRTVPLIVKPLR